MVAELCRWHTRLQLRMCKYAVFERNYGDFRVALVRVARGPTTSGVWKTDSSGTPDVNVSALGGIELER